MRFADYQYVRFEEKGQGVVVMTLNRPERLNATHEPMHQELIRVWRDVHLDRSIRALVVTGAGRAFSAGGDLAMISRMTEDYRAVMTMLEETQDLVSEMLRCDTPIVSAINGPAVGAGLVVALLADISIAAQASA